MHLYCSLAGAGPAAPGRVRPAAGPGSPPADPPHGVPVGQLGGQFGWGGSLPKSNGGAQPAPDLGWGNVGGAGRAGGPAGAGWPCCLP